MAWDATMFMFGSAMLAGLLSSPHCVGMCGTVLSAAQGLRATSRPQDRSAIHPIALQRNGTSAAATMAIPVPATANTSVASVATPSSAFADSFVFNAGRITSYVIAGALAGILSSVAATSLFAGDTMILRTVLYVIGQMMVIIMGLYIAGWQRAIAPLEQIGKGLWRWISPHASAQLKRSTGAHATLSGQFVLGLLWGWIPCGLVYTMLAAALAAQHPLDGAVTMLGFGLGTLPAMMLVGVSLARVRASLQRKGLRLVVGALFIAVGALNLSHVAGFSKLSAYGVFGAICQVSGIERSP